ncbi:Yip1-domain-containing protein [Anaeromyces robustus]|uniref:Protein YIP n=1 Tax=Anaeromyces robustus TaxID=1754192 RepID=A0A1Y1WZF0_9FUNG|nr:Yip1-domain-containing protein [Anaeromyces robustus]|eukprot:ORX78957.1 Yip1-domain-containing protein [Anaeromyces robustus]
MASGKYNSLKDLDNFDTNVDTNMFDTPSSSEGLDYAININMDGVSGNMDTGSSNKNTTNTNNNNKSIQDTLDEPVLDTLLRDLNNVWAKMKQVLMPTGNQNLLRDWDLWGPLILCMTLAIRLSMSAPENQSAMVFTITFIIIWCGAAVITVNSKLLGGKMSFFQSICILGYCIFPLTIVSLITLLIDYFIIDLILVLVGFAWSVYASIGFLTDVRLSQKKTLVIYPIFLFYFIIAWMILIE